MGNTIRRKPITTSIPDAPNYKYLNITNFGGLEISDNPFVVSSSSAKEMLNVYVDETNTLTTRPRLDLFPWRLGGNVISLLQLSNGLIASQILHDSGLVSSLKVGSSVYDSLELPTEKMVIFEESNKVYFIGGETYISFDLQTSFWSTVEPYIPITKAYKTDLTEGSDYESENVLVDAARHEYSSPIVLTSIDRFSKTDIIRKIVYEPKKEKFLRFVRKANTFTSPTKIQEGSYDKNGVFIVENEISIPSEVANATSVNFCVSEDENTLLLAYTLSDVNKLYVKYLTEEWVSIFTGDFLVSGFLSVNNSRTLVCVQSSDKKSVYFLNKFGDSYEQTTYTHNNTDVDQLVMNATGSLCVFSTSYWGQDNSSGTIYYTKNKGNTVYYSTFYGRMYYNYNRVLQISSYGKFVLYGNMLIKNLSSSGFTDITYLDYSKTNGMWALSQDGKFAYWIVLYGDDTPVLYNCNNNLYKKMEDSGVLGVEMPDIHPEKTYLSEVRGNYKHVIITNNLLRSSTDPDNTGGYISDCSVNYFEIVTTTNEIQIPSPRFVVHFDNNYWFFTDTKIYKTANNDPTYIPVDLITDVGNTSPFTGVNVISDTVMVVYTKDKLYAITDTSTTESDFAYTVTETRQTVGNTPLNAPIISAYNELVLQVNKDGIYALKTLENVQTTERIAEMISSNITPMWEKEADYVDDVITAKRLYWTYIIVPRETNSHIYLLDGRTNHWFYWELPIVVKFAWEYENKIRLLDSLSNVYTLNKEEVVTNLTENSQYTEYYDELEDEHKLIPWKWQSQILPLGTINYAKRVVSTTFILTDTDAVDKYGLNYKFTAYKKNVTNTPDMTLMNNIVYVQSVTKKTMLPRINFVQLTLSNISEENTNAYDTNKLRLTGLGIKYVLLSGGMT